MENGANWRTSCMALSETEQECGYYHLHLTVKRGRFFAKVYFSNVTGLSNGLVA